MPLQDNQQILKTRDDPVPFAIERDPEQPNAEEAFRLTTGQTCSWVKADAPFGPKHLRPRIEPWLTALVQSEHLSLLIGSGLSHAVHSIAVGKAAAGMDRVTFNVLQKEIDTEVNRIANSAGRKPGNLEDSIRVATELLRGLEIASATRSEDSKLAQNVSTLKDNLRDVLNSFATSILDSERRLVHAPPSDRNTALNYLVSFLMSFASRSGTRERLQLFTTNYDRYLEVGADTAGLRLIDRFVGTLTPMFRASRLDVDLHYNPPGIRGEPRYLEGVARFTKLHGSVDWVDYDGMIKRIALPFGAADLGPFLLDATRQSGNIRTLMVYPNAAKDRETAGYPYVELFRDLASAICRPNSTLVCYGYSFGDEHINRVVEDMLTIPSTHLVVIAHGDPLSRIQNTYDRLGRNAQTTLLIGNHLGDLRTLVDHYLPKPAIDRTTVRMADILKTRWGTEPHVHKGSDNESGNDEAAPQ